MADYKAIKGLGIQTFSGDLPNAASGDVWYNATLGKFRVHKLGAGAWSSAANLPTARKLKSSFGTKTAAIYVGGTQPPNSVLQTEVLKYNGTAWSEEADFPQELLIKLPNMMDQVGLQEEILLHNNLMVVLVELKLLHFLQVEP